LFFFEKNYLVAGYKKIFHKKNTTLQTKNNHFKSKIYKFYFCL
jgi:hypothetical protein